MKKTALMSALLLAFAAAPVAAQDWLERRDYDRDGRFTGALDDGTIDNEIAVLQDELDELRGSPSVRRLAWREFEDAQEYLEELEDERNVDEDDLDEAADRVEAVRLAALGRDADFDDADDDRYAAVYEEGDERYYASDDDLAYDDERRSGYDRTLYVQDEESKEEAARARSEADRARLEAERNREALVAAQLEAEHEKNRNARLRQELAGLQQKDTDRGLVVTLGDVLFETGKSELKPGATRNLDKLVAAMKQSKTATVLVEGHTDSVGKHDYNVKLSERRAAAVRSYLVKRGVPANRIQAAGMGPDHPVASNTSASGRQQNRRVELIIQNEVSNTRRVARDVDDTER